ATGHFSLPVDTSVLQDIERGVWTYNEGSIRCPLDQCGREFTLVRTIQECEPVFGRPCGRDADCGPTAFGLSGCNLGPHQCLPQGCATTSDCGASNGSCVSEVVRTTANPITNGFLINGRPTNLTGLRLETAADIIFIEGHTPENGRTQGFSGRLI